MTWFGYLFVGVFALSTLLTVGNVGKPRGPITPDTAVANTVINALLVWGALTVGVTQ